MHARTSSDPERPRGPGRRIGRRRSWVAVPFALGTLALTAACGGPYGGSATPAPAASNGAAPVAAASTDLGKVLVDARGRTVYEFANDTGTTSTCNGGCAQEWLPVVAPASVPRTLPGVAGDLGSTTRTDGSKQLTVAGHPVYTFSGDSAPGQTNGQGITLNGGLWNVASPAGSPIAAGSTSSGTY
jgi:predicted lipoprotein with Yx(FWY)xxD motif